ncbi:hypothetical protein LTR78_002904 [Recurvomyces mirabilis]|uniref:Uncharacterized protein n=1 Tax=Recurvomyces mirabilis TaxID=574656 RepID=A0AAE0WT27_9PEZI|nr:hypothetical protein LTR78_002904 [Recurvomyces mirabilis]KAK5159362.1 hypothetical protein LTS14_002504 [Recurvomyces mirabilis]
MSTANTNPSNFANLPTEEVKAIASMGGKASHKGDTETTGEDHKDATTTDGRAPDGTFLPGSEVAKEAGHKGGLHSHDHDGAAKDEKDVGRNPDGTFTKGSEAAKEAGHIGGMHSHGNSGLAEEEQDSGRNEDGTFKKGSEVAKQAGHNGGVAAAAAH